VSFLFYKHRTQIEKMYRAILTVVLEVDAETDLECENILQEMDYEFTHITMEEITGKQLIEIDRIISQEITEQEIEKV
jgi:hypothetical protein